MKKHILLIILIVSSSYANFFVGMRNQRYMCAGYKTDDLGVAFEQSLFNQDINLQHGRIAVFSHYQISASIDVQYSLFGGFQYNQDYYDFGSQVFLNWNIFKNTVFFWGRLQPIYDSEIKSNITYSAETALKPFRDVGVFVGMKNIPEYRMPEKRFLTGAFFDLNKLKVFAEISTPIQGSFEWTRVGVNFVYEAK